MDKFDDYLKKQSSSENEKLILPKSFDNKIEETLLNLDSENKQENNKWYINKKIWTTAACFAFICLAGFGLNKALMIEKSSNNARQPQEGAMIKSSNYDYAPETYGLEENSMMDEVKSADILSIDNIYSIKIEAITLAPKYKEIIKKEDISKIVELINTMPVYENIDGNIKDYQYSINVYGATDHIYMFMDNLISIDGTWYKTSDEEINLLNDLYKNLEYEEKLID